MVRGRTTAPAGLVLGHEITGEVIETGPDEYVLVPYADWNLLRFPDRDQALEKIMDLTMLSDILPTGSTARSRPASTPASMPSVSRPAAMAMAPRKHRPRCLTR